MKVLVIPISEKQWNSRDFSSSLTDALDAGRRIGKKLDIKNERKRFSMACNRIEAIAIQNGNNGKIELEGDVADSLVKALSTDGGITYPFVSPSDLPELIKRLKFDVPASLRRIQGGIAVLLIPYMSPSHRGGAIMPAQTYEKPSNGSQILLPEIDSDRAYLSKKQLVEITHRQIQDAFVSNRPINASSIPHEVFTEVIRCYLYRKNESIPFWKRLTRRLASAIGLWNPAPPVMLRITYSDGSEGKPFPLLYPLVKTRASDRSIMQVGLMSMRHSESLDPIVDVYR
jgi:hypothetical protein